LKNQCRSDTGRSGGRLTDPQKNAGLPVSCLKTGEEETMYLYRVNYLRRALRSLTMCTAPSVQRGAVVADANCLCSPYGGRHTVTYRVVQSYSPTLAAWNAHYNLWVGGDEPPEPKPLDNLVHDWGEFEIPRFVLQPLLNLAERLGLGHVELPDLVFIRLEMPRLAGFHYGNPVFFAAASDNTPLEVTGEPVYQQGHLMIFRYDDDLPLPLWFANEWFFNHARDERTSSSMYATPGAVLRDSVPHAAVRVAPGRVFSPDHDDLEIPEGQWLALHRFPERGAD